MPRFSIIITCYNQGDFIKEAVESALTQTCRDREIIVVDDGSSDGSRRVLERYAETITLELNATNGGAVAARNRGAAIARGDYLVFLDGDDRLLPWALDVYCRVVERKKTKLILAGMIYFSGYPPAEALSKRPEEIKLVEYADYFKKDRAYRASASAMVIDRETFNLVEGWTAGTFPADDQDLLFKLGCSGPAVQVLTPETSAYRLHANNTTRSILSLVEASHCLLKREKNGQYPGGRCRRFDRRAAMGGFLFFMATQTWRNQLRRDSRKLLAAGWRMIFAAILRRITVRLLGRNRRTEVLRFDSGSGAHE
ncbi:MAG: glycosyltransferase family 2 protein [Verrucomicrobia bacterium]|nr:glycosyltransferase family 2 protein [Verrucomicrobiota bacterium]